MSSKPTDDFAPSGPLRPKEAPSTNSENASDEGGKRALLCPVNEKCYRLEECLAAARCLAHREGITAKEAAHLVEHSRKALNVIDHPRYYVTHPSGIECIEITRHMNFNLGNVIKYIWRTDQKNKVEDLKKAQWYLSDEIKRIEKNNESK